MDFERKNSDMINNMNQMKNTIGIILFLLMNNIIGYSQKVTYSEILREDNRNMNFEILGNFNGNFLVYKNTQKSHRIAIYDKDLVLTNTVKLDFISDKTFNVDFITYPDYSLLFYQFQKGNYIYCNAAKIDAKGEIVGTEVSLDTTKVSFFASNKIYFLTKSEDRQKILLYKMLRKNETLSLSTSIFNSSLQKLDSTSNVFKFDDKRESYGDLEIDNDGTLFYTKFGNKSRSDYLNKVELVYRKLNSKDFVAKDVPLEEKKISDVNMKIDNRNNLVFLNAFVYKNNIGNVEGLLSAALDKGTVEEKKRAFLIFDDSVRNMLNNRTDWRTAFNSFNIQSIVLKKDSGILLSMEDYYTQTRGNYNRWNNNYYDPYYSPNYYRFQRNYSYYYWNDPYRNTDRDIVYNNNDVLVFNFDKDLKVKWTNVINKKQSDVGNDSYLSFATMNMGNEIHYLFIDKNKEIINDFALQPDGQIKRYATIKSGELGYSFMPRLLKQVSAREVIIPCIFRNFIGFAKINF